MIWPYFSLLAKSTIMSKAKSVLGQIALFVCLFPLLNGCGKIEDGLTAITWQLDFDLITTTWDIQFRDAATGELIGGNSDERVEVRIAGHDQASILDLAGVKQPRFYSTKGTLALALHPDRQAPGPLNSVRFLVQASHPGYIPASVAVNTATVGINPIKIYLTSRKNEPENVSMLNLERMSMVTNGRIRDSVELFTPGNGAMARISAGTEMIASSGAQLGGALDLLFAYWTGGSQTALPSLPGGQTAFNGQNQLSQIYLAGAIYLEIRDEFGKAAATLSKPVVTTLLIDKSVYNPVTGSMLQSGDDVPLWHFDPVNAVWIQAGKTITTPFQNKLTAALELSEPGFWFAGWFDHVLCQSPVSIQFNTLPEYDELPFAFTVKVFQIWKDEFRFIRALEIGGPVSEGAYLFNLPEDAELLIRFEPYITSNDQYYRSPDPMLLANYCEAGYKTQSDLLPKPNGTYKKIEVVFIDTKHNNTRYNPKMFPGYYRKSGAMEWQSAFVYQGQTYLVNPVVGSLYELGINYKGEFHKKEVVVGEEEVLLVEIEID